MAEDRAQAFLQLIRKSQRGRLKVYLGYGPGVGKTYQMLQEAHRLKKEGIDIVVGLVETHGRSETAKLVDGLEVIPRRKTEYHGIVVEEMDTDAILARRPQVVIVDELAHTNVPGSRNSKRYQDVQDILAAGIHVISALNVQHLESLYNTVEHLIGVVVRERLPDSVLAEADQIVNIDLAAEDLQQRLRDGKIYPRERVQSSLENFFTNSNLEHLRELALRELASQLDSKRRETTPQRTDAIADGSPDQIMVCLSSRGPNSARLLRFASRLAGRLNRNWYAVYVQTPSEEPTAIDAMTQRLLSDTLTLANQLGATVFTFKGTDVADTITRFAEEYRVGQVVIGKPRPIPWYRRLMGHKSVAEQLMYKAKNLTVIVVDAEAREQMPGSQPKPQETTATANAKPTLGGMLSPEQILIWDDPVSKAQLLHDLVTTASPGLDLQKVLTRLGDREKQGSTFLNEGVALPHARVEGITEPKVAMGLTHGGVLDAPTDRPVEIVFLLLSPTEGAKSHLQLLAAAGRALQKRDLRSALQNAQSPAAALQAIREAEQTAPAAAK